jgi:MOSC domain-containing protein YiiM
MLTPCVGLKKLALWLQDTGLTCFYLRCLEPGEVRAASLEQGWLTCMTAVPTR